MIFQKYPILRFGSTAAIVFSVDFVLLYLFHSVLGFDLVKSIVIAFLSAFIVNFSLNSFWVFESNELSGKSLFRFVQLVIFNLGIQTVSIPFFTELGLNYLFAKLLVVGILFLFNFEISRKYVFRGNLSEVKASVIEWTGNDDSQN